MDTGQITQVADMGGEHSAGGCLVERDRGDVSSPSPTAKQRSLRAVYVLNDGLKAVMASSPESGALQCLQRACDAESALLTTVTFGRLDFGETSVLDSFYDAGWGGRLLFLFFCFCGRVEVALLLCNGTDVCTVTLPVLSRNFSIQFFQVFSRDYCHSDCGSLCNVRFYMRSL